MSEEGCAVWCLGIIAAFILGLILITRLVPKQVTVEITSPPVIQEKE